MSKQSFEKRLNVLTNEAHAFIENRMKKLAPKKVLHLFVPSKEDCTENKKGESLFDMPNFQVYDKYSSMGYANITKLVREKKMVLVCGINKNDVGSEDKMYIHELDAQDIIRIADYLQ